MSLMHSRVCVQPQSRSLRLEDTCHSTEHWLDEAKNNSMTPNKQQRFKRLELQTNNWKVENTSATLRWQG